MSSLLVILSSILYRTLSVDYYPSSDPDNSMGWTPVWELTDEFWNQNTLNSDKWYDYNPSWAGNQPSWFDPDNVEVSDGKLYLNARIDWNAIPQEYKELGYSQYTTSAITAKQAIKYGYIEIKAKIGGGAIQSAFWLSNNKKWSGGSWTEIDIFENPGTSGMDGRSWAYGRMHSNTHVFSLWATDFDDVPDKCQCTNKDPDVENCSDSEDTAIDGIDAFSDDFNVFGIHWTASFIKLYVNGEQVRYIKNRCFFQELILKLSRATMEHWGYPTSDYLPDEPFTIEYIRTWQSDSDAFTEEDAENDGTKGDNNWIFAVCATLIALIIIGIVIFCVIKRRKQKMAERVTFEDPENDENTKMDDKKIGDDNKGYDMSPIKTDDGVHDDEVEDVEDAEEIDVETDMIATTDEIPTQS